jgi:hypothetical protein
MIRRENAAMKFQKSGLDAMRQFCTVRADLSADHQLYRFHEAL